MTDDHLSLDELAELDEGLLPPERTSAVRAHLHGCGVCRARAEAITTTRARLADLPAVTMPEHVAARLDRALAAEAAAVDDTAGDVETEPAVEAEPAAAALPIDLAARTTTITPRGGSVSRPRFGRPTSATTAVAAMLVLFVGAIVFGHFHHGSSPESAGSTSASLNGSQFRAGGTAPGDISPSQPTNLVVVSTGQTYTTSNLAKNVPGLIARVPQTDSVTTPGNVAGSPTTSAPPASSPTSHAGAGSGTAASGGTARGGKPSTASARPKTLSTLNQTQGASTLESQPVPRSLQPLYHSRQKLLQCAAYVSGQQNAVPLAVDFGRWTNGSYHRAPSIVLVFRDNDPATVSVFVYGPKCDGNSLRTFSQVPTGD